MKKLLYISFLFIVFPLHSQTTYTFTTTGDWSNPTNWDVYPGYEINIEDTVNIPSNLEVTVDLSILNYGTITGNGNIISNDIIQNFGEMTIGGEMTNNNLIENYDDTGGGTITINGKVINNGTLTSVGTIINNGFISNRVDGLITNDRVLTNNDRIDNYGEFRNNSILNDSKKLTNYGIFSGGFIINLGTITNSNDAEFTSNGIKNMVGSTLYNHGMFTNNGKITNYVSTVINTSGFFQNNGILDGDGTITNSGTLINEWQIYTINFWNTGCFVNNYWFQLTGGYFIHSGELKGTNIAHKGYINNSAKLSPGYPLGIYTLDFNFTNTLDGTLNIEIGGTGTPGVDYDQLSVIGDANLDGKITIRYLNNYEPEIGDSFTVLTASNITGTFSIIDFPALVDKEWSVTYNSNSIVIEVMNPLSIKDGENIPDLMLYPNPTPNITTIQSKTPIAKIEVYNNTGRKIFSVDNKMSVDVSSLSTGVYFIKVKDVNGAIEIKKIVRN